tara:strand:- start:16255 stop:16683 length:429 start_codon:yes stop_codon:yes gene_type:complete
VIKIRHTGIVTKDIKKSLYFWNKIFKFKINKDLNEKGKTLDKVLKHRNVKVRTLKLKDDFGNLIELLYFKSPKAIDQNKYFTNSKGITHLSVTVKNINYIYKKYKKKIKFNSKPLLSEDKKVLMTYCRTPEGCFLELVQELK